MSAPMTTRALLSARNITKVIFFILSSLVSLYPQYMFVFCSLLSCLLKMPFCDMNFCQWLTNLHKKRVMI